MAPSGITLPLIQASSLVVLCKFCHWQSDMNLYKFFHLCFRREAIKLQEEKKLQLQGRRPGLWRLHISNSWYGHKSQPDEIFSELAGFSTCKIFESLITQISSDALQAISVVLIVFLACKYGK